MKTKLLSVIVGVILFAPFSAYATTYDYAGPLYTVNTDPSLLGSSMTGAVTFNFDTSSFSGTIPIGCGEITNLVLTSGSLTFSTPDPGDALILTAGVITTWYVKVVISADVYLMTETADAFIGGNGPSLAVDTSPNYAWDTGSPGVWTCVDCSSNPVAATPLPTTWLMLLSGFVGLGFFAYRGMKKNTAALAAA